MYYVYRIINATAREVYHGVTADLTQPDIQHCSGIARDISHWKGSDDIRWYVLSRHGVQNVASREAHHQEQTYSHPLGFHVHTSSGPANSTRFSSTLLSQPFCS